jgi:hypothetical protein
MPTTLSKSSDWRRVIARHVYPQKLSDAVYHYPTADNRKLAICGEEMNDFSRDTTRNLVLRVEKATICQTCETLDPVTPTYN